MHQHEFLKKFSVMIFPTGSRVICNPPPTDTDEDYLVFVPSEQLNMLCWFMEEEGFELGGSYPEDIEDGDSSIGMTFYFYKKGDLNYIITDSETLARKFAIATNIAQKLNLLEKGDRISLFQAVLYDNHSYCTAGLYQKILEQIIKDLDSGN